MIKDFFNKPIKFNRRIGLTILCALLFLAIAISNLPAILSVSSKVGDRELPIYCVETDKPQIALSFDAAWGNT